MNTEFINKMILFVLFLLLNSCNFYSPVRFTKEMNISNYSKGKKENKVYNKIDLVNEHLGYEKRENGYIVEKQKGKHAYKEQGFSTD